MRDNRFIFYILLFFCFLVIVLFPFMSSASSMSLDDLDGLEWRYIDDDRPDYGVEHYKPLNDFHGSYSTFSSFGPLSLVDNYPSYEDFNYWFFYDIYVYASDYPFVFYNGKISSFNSGMSFSFSRYTLGVFSGPNPSPIFTVDIPKEKYSLIKPNHNILDSSSDSVVVSCVDSYSVPSIPSGLNYVYKFSYYTFASQTPINFKRVGDNLVFFNSSNYSYLFKYSYLGSDFIQPPYPKGFVLMPYVSPLDDYYVKFFSISNHPVLNSDDSVYFDYSNPPIGWVPFDPDIVIGPGGPDEPGDSGDYSGFFGTIISYINPRSDDFFLKIAIIPRDDYFKNKFISLYNASKGKFNFLEDIIDSLDVVFSGDYGNTGQWGGIDYGDRKLLLSNAIISCNADNYDTVFGLVSPTFCAGTPGGLGDLRIAWKYKYEYDLSSHKLLDGDVIVSFIQKFRHYTSSVMMFFFMIWLIRWLLSFFGFHMPFGGYSPGNDGSDGKGGVKK